MILKVYCKILVLLRLVKNFALGYGESWKSLYGSYLETTHWTHMASFLMSWVLTCAFGALPLHFDDFMLRWLAASQQYKTRQKFHTFDMIKKSFWTLKTGCLFAWRGHLQPWWWKAMPTSEQRYWFIFNGPIQQELYGFTNSKVHIKAKAHMV